jgi:hypothetical protein
MKTNIAWPILIATLSTAAPAGAVDPSLCRFLKTAVADAPNNFKRIARSDGGLKPGVAPDYPDNCGVQNSEKGLTSAACVWGLSEVMKASRAQLELDELSRETALCLGKAYRPSRGSNGGTQFSDPKGVRVGTDKFLDVSGIYQIFIKVNGTGR